MRHHIFFLFLTCLALFSCEKADLGEFNQKPDDGKVKVTFNITGVEQVPFENTKTRGTEDLFSRLTISLFQGDTKVKNISQTSNDDHFGTVAIDLTPGTYQLVAIAHNGLGNCTVSSPEKITFASNKMTDTFYYYGTIEVKETGNNDLILKRAVSMFRLITTDDIPESVAKMQFYFTGGSSTFNATTGFGCVNSKQTEVISIENSKNTANGKAFEIYTFPHEITDDLTIKVTALDASGNTITEATFNNVPIQQNVITQYTTPFFTNPPGTITSFTTTATIENNGQWHSTIDM